MPYETLFSAVVGAGPTLLIAYAVEQRGYRQRLYAHHWLTDVLAFITLGTLTLATLLALYGLMTPMRDGTYAEWTGFLLGAGVISFLSLCLSDIALYRDKRKYGY